jgi:hypothetical protein
MLTAAEYQARYTEAETALHKLMTGSAVEEVTAMDGTRVRYTPATLASLQSYMNWLQQQIETVQRGNRRPIYISFGR